MAQSRPELLQSYGDQFLRGIGRQFAGRHHRPEGWQRPALRSCVGARVIHSMAQIARLPMGFNAGASVLSSRP